MSKRTAATLQVSVLAAIIVLVAVGLWQVHRANPMLLSFQLPVTNGKVMGTTCELRAVVAANDKPTADRALRNSLASLEATERCFSAWQDDSEIAKLNKAKANMLFYPSPGRIELLELMAMSKDLARDTGGAFDVTFAPVFNVWKVAGETKRMPEQADLDEARQASGWNLYELHPDSIMKYDDNAQVDLGGVAKGYGIDQAVKAMQSAGVKGGLVNIGGDIRCFGKNTDGRKWRISIENPFTPGKGKPLGVITLDQGAVCTSGNYERFVIIDGKRYSHIVDPRTGWPVDSAPSVTVVARTAALADAWATALSVLASGPDGPNALSMLKDTGIEAMIVIGDEKNHTIHKTPGFELLLDKKK